MSTGQSHRLAQGGVIDRDRPLGFSFDRKAFRGYAGDTLASALLANGVGLLGRSFKYHRPRGILSAGSEEPNALVELRSQARREPNSRATVAELYEGLEAYSQNRFPSLKFDLLAFNDWLSPFLSAGFYYKTFMWPAAFWEKYYEPAIRKAAGLGSLSGHSDPDQYEKGFLHCDVLVIGAGPAGLAAALAAGRAGCRVILADEDFLAGGRLLSENGEIDSMPSARWAGQTAAELASLDNVRILPRTTVFGAYDHGIFGALERLNDHLSLPPKGQPRHILWRIYTKQAILASGALERPIAFGNNDRPGIMMAGAMRSYLNRFAVRPGDRFAVFTNNSDGWRTAADLVANGAEVAAIIDTRQDIEAPAEMPEVTGIRLFSGGRVVSASGRQRLSAIDAYDGAGRREHLQVDALAVSGGWNPSVHLTSHKGARPVWEDSIAAFIPAETENNPLRVIGAAAGHFSTHQALADGVRAGQATAEALGQAISVAPSPVSDDAPYEIKAYWYVADSVGRAWIDFQNDVTTKDITTAHQEGFRSVEHLKRYTTLGMATDQGKTGNVLGLAVMAELTGHSIPETGTTIFRPPYNPVPIGAFAGRSRGKDFRPTRLTPSHDWACDQGAVFVETGAWLRAQWFPQAGETHWRQSVDREVAATRASVGVCDVTTLGKIDIQGSDAAAFLNFVYANGFAKLAVGKCRYGLMLREDGLVMDDGTTARLSDDHYVMTTTTANAVSVFRHLEFCRQCLWPDMDVQLISVTEQWAQYAIAGPNSRALLQKIVDPDFDISNDAFPYMACGAVTVCGGVRGRLFRLSFSGELAFEIAVPARYGHAMIKALMAAGTEYNVVAYGTEALGVMRVEKGHPAGNELNGTTTARNLGMGRMVSKKADCIGNILSERPGLNQEDGLTLVGFKPVHEQHQLSAGAHFIGLGKTPVADNDEGYMTSVAFSPTLGHSIGLGLIHKGEKRIGEHVRAVDLVRGTDIEVEIISPHMFDPKGERLRG